jgi:hypothetical protein
MKWLPWDALNTPETTPMKFRYVDVLPGIKLRYPNLKIVYTDGKRILIPVKVLNK